MKPLQTQQFFADFCKANPQQAYALMMHMINNPMGRIQIVLPALVNDQDVSQYYKKAHAMAKEYILKPREVA